MWLEKDERRVYFDCKVVENGTQVISGAYVDLHGIKSAGETTSAPKSTPSEAGSGPGMVADKIFEEISLKLKEKPDLAKSINAVYAFQITKEDKTKIFSTFFSSLISFLTFEIYLLDQKLPI